MTNKGKMVYCKETFQVFPSVKAAAEYHKIGYHSIAKNVEGKTKVAHGKHFIYLENTADLSQFFADTRKQEKEKELMRKAAAEKLAELTTMQKQIAKDLAEARKIMKKYT
jgi:5-bromo-4-chloroindolyl phosphate hydrolysis protein